MRRIIIVISVCLAIFIFYPLSINAADELLVCDPGVTFIDIGDIIECDINPIGDSDIFQFSGIIGEDIRLTLSDQGGPVSTSSPCLRLKDPDDQVIGDWCASGTGVSNEFVLEKDGTYTIFVNENNDDSWVPYRLAMQRKFPPPPEALSLLYDQVLEDIMIDPVPDSDVFLFEGTSNDMIRLTLVDRGGPVSTSSPCLRLFDPDDQQIGDWCASGTGVSNEFVLEKDGTYTIFVNENNDDSWVPYNLALQCLLGSCLFPIPIPTCAGQNATIIGTEGDNVIMGTAGDDVIVGLGGNDIIYGLDGRDRICGGEGDDTIYGGPHNDRLLGDNGNDILRGDSGRDVLSGNGGNDTLDGGSWHDKLIGGWGNDTLFGSGGDDELIGGVGTDVCDGDNHVIGDTADSTCEVIVNTP